MLVYGSMPATTGFGRCPQIYSNVLELKDALPHYIYVYQCWRKEFESGQAENVILADVSVW